ncbi:MAG: hypothetical protein ABIH25_03310 [Candidatus Woesearchaeota archaeon]
MELISKLIEKLEDLIQNDSGKIREEIAEICSRFLNEEFEAYKKLNGETQDVIDGFSVMDEIEGRKEPKILHIEIDEIKQLLQKLKAAVE